MGMTDALMRVHQVDTQLRDLQVRLRAAERFLNEQEKQVSRLEAQHAALQSQLRQAKAAGAERETEGASIQGRIDHVREQMNLAQTNKQYKAFLSEVNTFKADKDRMDEEAIEFFSKADELADALKEIESQRDERVKMRDVANDDKRTRADEIKERVEELEAQRKELVGDVPGEALAKYNELVRTLDDDAMAPIQEQDRKRHEYSCGACMMSIPIETVSALLGGADRVITCVNCGCLLYVEPELAEEVHSSKR